MFDKDADRIDLFVGNRNPYSMSAYKTEHTIDCKDPEPLGVIGNKFDEYVAAEEREFDHFSPV